MAMHTWPAWATAWYSFLCAMAMLNIGLTLYLLRSGRNSDSAQPAWYSRTLRFLGAIYVLVVAYRSIFPADYPHRYVFWDNMMSSILIHRGCAAVEEVAWVLQIVLVQIFCASQVKQGPASFCLVLYCSTCMVLVIVIAECFSFAGTITQSFRWFAWEETCWAISFAIGFPVYVHLLAATCKLNLSARKQIPNAEEDEDAGKSFSAHYFALTLVVFCVGYVPYMAIVDIPSYWNDYHEQQLQGFVPNGFGEGVWNALTFRDPTHDLSLWQSSILWKTVYFSLGPWLSMALMTAPVVEVAAAESDGTSQV